MNIFKRFVYIFVKKLAIYSFRIFYREKVILHPEHLKITKPTIIVSNHPSTLTDPLHVGIELKVYAHFLINAGLVQHWFSNWFFNTFFCIPVMRSKDTGDRKINNKQSFARANEFLAKGGTLYIAPEGISNMERRLQPLKTGIARIALSAEAENDFQLDLQIQPFGLNYTGLRFFRSSIVMECGAPFSIKEFQQLYEDDPREAVNQVCEKLSAAMKQTILHTQDDDEDELLKNMGQIAQSKEKLSLKGQYLRSKKTLENIQALRVEDEIAYAELQARVNKLSWKLTEKKSDQNALHLAGMKSIAKESSSRTLRLLLGFPFFLYGWINNFLPNFLPGFLAKKMNIYKGYDPAIKILSGIILYPLLYGLQLFFVQSYFGQWWISLIYFLSIFPLGLFAWNYRQRFLNWRKERAMISWQRQKPQEVKKWFEQQGELSEIFSRPPQEQV